MPHLTPVLVQTPAHSQVAGPLTYTSGQALPPGTLVRLHGGEVGVFRNGVRSGERPGVWVLYDPSGMPLLRPQARQLDVRKDIAGHVRPETCRSAALILKQLWCKPLEGLTA